MSSSVLGLQRKGIGRSIPFHSKNKKRRWSLTAALHPLKHHHSILRIVSLTVKWEESCKITLYGASRDCPSLSVTRSLEFRLSRTLLTACPQALTGVLVTLFTKVEEKIKRIQVKLRKTSIPESVYARLMTTKFMKTAKELAAVQKDIPVSR